MVRGCKARREADRPRCRAWCEDNHWGDPGPTFVLPSRPPGGRDPPCHLTRPHTGPLCRRGATDRRTLHRRRVLAPHVRGQLVPDLLRRDFTATGPDRVWISDITYLPVAGGRFLYLATVIDVCSRRPVGWSIADHMLTELVTDVLDAAVRTRQGRVNGVNFRSGHGAHCSSKTFADARRTAGIQPVRGRGRHVGRQCRRQAYSCGSVGPSGAPEQRPGPRRGVPGVCAAAGARRHRRSRPGTPRYPNWPGW